MPLPNDEKLLALSQGLINQFDELFGLHPGFRPAHAKGILLGGTFVPAPYAESLTIAPHMVRPSTPVTVRFSNSTGVPMIPDNDSNANPRGMAIRFNLAEHVHTDIVAHSTDGFPTRTGGEFLEFLRAAAASGASTSSPSPIEVFLGGHPAALAFVQAPKPSPSSFAHEAYFGVTAMRFINAQGAGSYGRYRITPEAGVKHLDDDMVKAKGADFLFEEIVERTVKGPVSFHLNVQLAEQSDEVNDATVHWPETRRIAPLGTITLTSVVADQVEEQKKIIFDPIPRVNGIEPSDDPLLELRAAIYLMSGRRRRQAAKASTA